MPLLPSSRRAQTFGQFAALLLIYALLVNAGPSPLPETLTISFPPQPATAIAQTWPTDSAASGDASQWSDSTGGDTSQWSGSTGGHASQWSGAGGAGAGAYDPAAFASMFTLDLEAMRVAHAVMASACMLIFFPFGGVILRLVSVENHPHIVWFHAGVQMFAYTLFLAAAGVGIWMAKNYGVIGGYHPIVGMCILVGMSFQPLTEILNHFFYARYPKILYLGYVHLWLGRVLITLGMINGGLGFAFADTIPYQPVWSIAPKIVYAVIAGIVWTMYFLFCGVWQQVKYVRRMSHPGVGGEEMENLRGREGVRVEENVEADNGSKVNVAEGDGRRRKVSPLPTQAEFRSSAL